MAKRKTRRVAASAKVTSLASKTPVPTETSYTVPTPPAFLQVRCHDLSVLPTVCGLCAGYEGGNWRAEALADHLVDWLPEFALTPEEWLGINHANSVSMIREAARIVYSTEKFAKRGEFGELLLHAAIRQVYNSLPAISKIYYKSAANDTVKGFDAVHVVGTPDEMELWLGEAKFYTSYSRAVAEVVDELQSHLEADYLRSEFLLLKGKIDNSWPHASKLKRLLSQNTSLDDVFSRVCIPVLLTYDSKCVNAHAKCTSEYAEGFEKEVYGNLDYFNSKIRDVSILKEVRVHLFLMPLQKKKVLMEHLDRKLKAWQQI